MILNVFEELCDLTGSKALTNIPKEVGRFTLLKGLRLQGLREIQSYSLFVLFNAIEVSSGLKEVEQIKTKLKENLTLEKVALPNKVSLEEIRSSFDGLLHRYEFIINVELKGF